MGDPGHDHQACIRDAIAAAEARCRDRRIKLTSHRRRVLEILAERHAAIGAYDILARMSAEGSALAPMAVYRALDFLLDLGLAHRLASRNAYVACCRPARAHAALFLICEDCAGIAELEDETVAGALARSVEIEGFAMKQGIVEILGRCRSCRKLAPS